MPPPADPGVRERTDGGLDVIAALAGEGVERLRLGVG
jgi:hypothetical protein